MIADDDIDRAVVDVRVDVNRDRLRLPCVVDRIPERLVRGEQDVEQLVLGGILLDQPEPEMGAEQSRLCGFRGQTEFQHPVDKNAFSRSIRYPSNE